MHVPLQETARLQPHKQYLFRCKEQFSPAEVCALACALITEVLCVQVQLPQRDGEYVPCPDKIRELMRVPAWRDCCRKINHAANYATTCVLPLAKHGGKGLHQPVPFVCARLRAARRSQH